MGSQLPHEILYSTNIVSETLIKYNKVERSMKILIKKSEDFLKVLTNHVDLSYIHQNNNKHNEFIIIDPIEASIFKNFKDLKIKTKKDKAETITELLLQFIIGKKLSLMDYG